MLKSVETETRSRWRGGEGGTASLPVLPLPVHFLKQAPNTRRNYRRRGSTKLVVKRNIRWFCLVMVNPVQETGAGREAFILVLTSHRVDLLCVLSLRFFPLCISTVFFAMMLLLLLVRVMVCDGSFYHRLSKTKHIPLHSPFPRGPHEEDDVRFSSAHREGGSRHSKKLYTGDAQQCANRKCYHSKAS